MSTPDIDKKIVVDGDGQPIEVIIPYAQFVELSEAYGLDLNTEARGQIAQAEADVAAGNLDAFTDLSEIREQLASIE